MLSISKVCTVHVLPYTCRSLMWDLSGVQYILLLQTEKGVHTEVLCTLIAAEWPFLPSPTRDVQIRCEVTPVTARRPRKVL